MKHYISFLVLILTFAFQDSYSQENNVNNYISKTIKKNGQAFLKNKTINSVSIGVYKESEIYTQHFGEIEKGKGNTPNNQTIYEVGSVTKTMTGYLVAKAVLEEKINLDDDVRLYLKGDFSNLQFNGNPITIKHLLTHTSGLPMFLPMEMNGVFEKFNENVPTIYSELEKSYDKSKFLEDLKNVSIKSEPGINYFYSNAGAELIGYILETVYQKNSDKLLQESFLIEYNMNNTAIRLNETKKQNLIRGYWMNNETLSPNQLNKLWATGSGAKMTLKDMMSYIKLQLNKQNPIVSESHKVLFEEGKTFKIAYFWRVWNDYYGTSYNHHGGTSGTQNWLFIFPKYELGISIITNHSGPKTPKKLSKTVKKILNDIVKK